MRRYLTLTLIISSVFFLAPNFTGDPTWPPNPEAVLTKMLNAYLGPVSDDETEWVDISLPFSQPRVSTSLYKTVPAASLLREVTGVDAGITDRPACAAGIDGDVIVAVDSYWWDPNNGDGNNYHMGVPQICNSQRTTARWETYHEGYVWNTTDINAPGVIEDQWVDGYGSGGLGYDYVGGGYRMQVNGPENSCRVHQIFGGPGIKTKTGNILEFVVQLTEIDPFRSGITGIWGWVNIQPPGSIPWDIVNDTVGASLTSGFGFIIDRGVVKAFTSRNGATTLATLWDMAAACGGACNGFKPQDNSLSLALRIHVSNSGTPTGAVTGCWKEGAMGSNPWTDTPVGESILGWQCANLPTLVSTIMDPSGDNDYAVPTIGLCDPVLGVGVNIVGLRRFSTRVKDTFR